MRFRVKPGMTFKEAKRSGWYLAQRPFFGSKTNTRAKRSDKMRMKFLEAVAARYAGRPSLERTCFVFPNRRSSTFFKRYLGLAAAKPLFVPSMCTIDELFQRISGLRPVDKVPALDRLYRLYRELLQENGRSAEPFDDFIYWGDILLSDYDDIDKYRVDADKMLVNLRELKELSSDYDFLTETQKQAIAEFCGSFFKMPGQALHDGPRQQFAELWNILHPLYTRFREALQRDGLGYAGMIYRSVAEAIRPDSQLLPAFDEVVFIGLNALNNCEIALLTELQKEGKADFFWDFEGPLLQDPANKAGRFIRENIARFPSRQPLEGIAPEGLPAIEVIRVPSAVGQTRKAMQVIEELHAAGHMDTPEETAVVLPDESLLFPMLGALPASVEKVNITMGYPLSAGQVETLLAFAERLQANRRTKGGTVRFYHRDVSDLLEHPYITAADTEGVVPAVRTAIREQNRIFVDAAWLASQSPLFAILFTPVEGSADLADWLQRLIQALQAQQPTLEREFLYRYSATIAALAGVKLDYDTLEQRTWFRLLARLAALESVPFEGEPLSGLQMMGPLETRALDFRNIIMLSVGEGIFPSRTVSSSFIPYNLRVGFGLPTYELQDAIWSYYFYRSICRAERVWLLYDSRTEGLQSGEESRYIKQLKYHYGLPVTEKVATYALGVTAAERSVVTVEKSPAVLQELHERFVTGDGTLSASSLNSYIDCPLKFYYQYVRRIKEQEDVTEEVDASLFGDIYHEVMQKIYEMSGAERAGSGAATFFREQDGTRSEAELITKELIDHLRRDTRRLEQLTVEAFQRKGIEEIEGENAILKNLVLRFVDRTLEVDAELAPFTFLGAEAKRRSQFQLPDGRTVRLFGSIDRLDSLQPGTIRVVDYKTGSVERKDDCRSVERIFDRTLSPRPYIAFQLYFYALLMSRQPNAGATQYHPCVYALRDIFKGQPEAHAIEPEKLAQFADRVQALVEEIFNPEKPFAGDCADDNICGHCPFKRVCKR